MDSQLTPDNVEQTFTVVPESTDPGAFTGDSFDADGEPLEPTDSLDTEGIDVGENDGEPLRAEDSAGTDAAPAADLAELEALRQAKAERDQWQQWYVQQQSEAQQQQAAQYWTQQETQAAQYFAAREQKIYADAERAYDAPAFIREQMTRLNQERSSWGAQYQQAREQTMWQQYAASQVPAYAQHVAQHYGLGADAAQELMSVPPDYMPMEAARLAREQHLFRQLDQMKRSQAASAVAGNSVAPGGGRATGGRIKAGSRAHLMALLNQ